MQAVPVLRALVCLAVGLAAAPAAAGLEGRPAWARIRRDSVSRRTVATGIEVLRAKKFGPLVGKRVGLVTNQTGVDRHFQSTVDILASAPGVKLAAIFSPEHGIRGTLDGDVAHGRDPRTGIRIHSLYGATRRPTDRMLAGLDALVFDIQDVGARFYTYISTMGYCMEAAARRGIPMLVLDRPNPIGGVRVEGPVMDPALTGFTGYHTLPNRHGMTVGELALMFNEERRIGCDLVVVAMDGWTRDQYFEDTGCPWVNTSPNIRSPGEAVLYAGIGALESTNLSVGRGTDTPFEVIGAPWIDAPRLAGWLRERDLSGVRFTPVVYTPEASVHEGKRCHGVFITVTDRKAFDSVRCGLEIAFALHRSHRDAFEVGRFAGMIGRSWVVDRIREGVDPRRIQSEWESSRRAFLRRRERFLLYPAAGDRPAPRIMTPGAHARRSGAAGAGPSRRPGARRAASRPAGTAAAEPGRGAGE
jgi:uncharacterized protein YbbC (DUF1343 family)